MPIPHVDVRAQYAPLVPELKEAFARTLESGRFIFGPEVEGFEREAAEHLGVEQTVGVANGTDAIVLVLDALGIGSGDEVICPSFTFYATAEAIARVGATPVFAEIDPATLNLDPADVAGRITSELFYSQMFDFGSAAVKYAEIAVSPPPQASSVYAVLVGRQQDIGPYPPQGLIVTVAQGSRIYVLAAKPEVAIEMIPACDAIWQAAVAKRTESYQTKSASKAGDDTRDDEIENAGDKAFHRCFAEKAKAAEFYPALQRQAQGLVDRIEAK